jgi:hypothetical protein
MKSKRIEKVVFITEDGQEFDDEAKAKKHEEIASLVQRISLLTPVEIEELFGMFHLKPKEIPQPVQTDLKKKISDLLMRHGKIQATPEALLGNMIMELQDLIR